MTFQANASKYRKVGRVGTGGASWDEVKNLENRESTARASFRWCRGSFRCFSGVLPKIKKSAHAGESLFLRV